MAGCTPFFWPGICTPFGAAGCTAPFALACVTLDVDSAFDTGQKPPLCFFFAGAGTSPLAAWALSFTEVTVEVEEVDEFDASDDEEGFLVTTFL